METLIRNAVAAALLCVAPAASSDDAATGGMVYGGDKDDGWAVSFSTPKGWNFDCCKTAARVNANLLVFPSSWQGADRNGVVVLNVWKKAEETLADDWAHDEADYKKDYPDITTNAFDVKAKDATCRAAVYTSQDHLRDYVVFCDPGPEWKYRFSWSMLISSDDGVAKNETSFREIIADAHLLHMTHKP